MQVLAFFVQRETFRLAIIRGKEKCDFYYFRNYVGEITFRRKIEERNSVSKTLRLWINLNESFRVLFFFSVKNYFFVALNRY